MCVSIYRSPIEGVNRRLVLFVFCVISIYRAPTEGVNRRFVLINVYRSPIEGVLINVFVESNSTVLRLRECWAIVSVFLFILCKSETRISLNLKSCPFRSLLRRKSVQTCKSSILL